MKPIYLMLLVKASNAELGRMPIDRDAITVSHDVSMRQFVK